MTTTVFLVRHATYDRLGKVLAGRTPGVNLSDKGHAEAACLAERLKDENLAAVYTSPLERARQTAEPIAEATGAELRVDEGIQELGFGDWEGAEIDQLEDDPRWKLWNRDRTHVRAPGGETIWEAQHRAVRWLEGVAREHPGEAIAAVSHADIIKALIAHGLGLPLDLTYRFEVSPASLSVIVAGDWGLKVHSINEVCR
ncbi:MAG: histidine phosphatase family protein [Ignavibacteriales bacterium]